MTSAIVSVTISLFIGFVLGAMLGDKIGYDRGCQETHDYYHSKGLIK